MAEIPVSSIYEGYNKKDTGNPITCDPAPGLELEKIDPEANLPQGRAPQTRDVVAETIGRGVQQQYNEGLELEKIVAEKARLRQGTRTDLGHNIPQNFGGCKRDRETSNIIARTIGLGSRTQWDKLKQVAAHKPELLPQLKWPVYFPAMPYAHYGNKVLIIINTVNYPVITLSYSP